MFSRNGYINPNGTGLRTLFLSLKPHGNQYWSHQPFKITRWFKPWPTWPPQTLGSHQQLTDSSNSDLNSVKMEKNWGNIWYLRLPALISGSLNSFSIPKEGSRKKLAEIAQVRNHILSEWKLRTENAVSYIHGGLPNSHCRKVSQGTFDLWKFHPALWLGQRWLCLRELELKQMDDMTWMMDDDQEWWNHDVSDVLVDSTTYLCGFWSVRNSSLTATALFHMTNNRHLFANVSEVRDIGSKIEW